MSLSPHKIAELQDALNKILSPQIQRILEAVQEPPGPNNPYYIKIPNAEDMNLTAEELGSLVARTSNVAQDAFYNAGVARAEAKIAEARYKVKFKTNLSGKNPAEREANAMNASADEFVQLSLIEAIVELAESQEAAARIASESARKLFDKVHGMNTAAAREEHGRYQEKDFTSQW